MENSDAERIARLEARFRLLSGALRSFAEATTDYERLLDVIARGLSDIVRDGCVVRLLSGNGWLAPVAIHLPVEERVHDHAAAAKVRALILRQHHSSEQGAARRVLETGEAWLVPKLDLEELRATTAPDIVDAYEAIGIHSILLVALRTRGQSMGLLSLVRCTPGSPPFGEQDRELAQTLADHAALAIENARLFKNTLKDLAERERTEATLRSTEAQLRHAQKMEAVGRLAGGVAHDFNNVLTVILSYAELVGSDERLCEPLRADVEQMRTAGLRAAELTHQLLAFSRQQVLEPRVLDLAKTVENVEQMLRRLVGASVALTLLPASDLWNISADSGQIEQIVMNLVANARDAMPDGGALTIELANVELDEEYASAHDEVTAGPYVMLAVTDTGVGMDRETSSRVFEPFFTTKAKGKGTGLGLATVFGIVKQSGGHIWIYSERSVGTTFKLYFPRVDHDVEPPDLARTPRVEGSRNETVLLVEDDDQVRSIARNVLRRSGYVVLEAPNAGEALLISEQHGAKIHLLLTDVVLPRMNGRLLAERLRAERPDMKVLFMSGYTDDAVLQHGILDSDVAYLQKPLTPGSLTKKVREVLDAEAAR